MDSYIEKLLNEILKNPTEPKNYLELSNIYIAKKDYNNALDVYKKLLSIEPMNVEALINAGSLSYYLGNYDSAINFYFRATEIESDNFYIYFNLANAYCETKKFDKAYEYYKKSLDLNVNDYLVLNSIGLMYQDMDDIIQSKLYYQRAINLSPDNPEAYMNIAGVFMKTDCFESALQNYLKAFELDNKKLSSIIMYRQCVFFFE